MTKKQVYWQTYYKKNKEILLEKNKQYYLTNKEERNKKHHQWRINNMKHVKKYEAIYNKTEAPRIKLLKRYKLTIDQYNQMLVDQNSNCAICGRNQSEFNRVLSVDHCHSTGKIRGLLCSQCNSGIGLLQDNADILDKAAIYLRK